MSLSEAHTTPVTCIIIEMLIVIMGGYASYIYEVIKNITNRLSKNLWYTIFESEFSMWLFKENCTIILNIYILVCNLYKTRIAPNDLWFSKIHIIAFAEIKKQ